MKTQRPLNQTVNDNSNIIFSQFNNQASTSFKTLKNKWSVDRLGRMILGFMIIGVALIILFGGVIWTILLVLAGLNLIITSIINNCLFNKFLCSLGFKEREEIYEPGGHFKNIK